MRMTLAFCVLIAAGCARDHGSNGEPDYGVNDLAVGNGDGSAQDLANADLERLPPGFTPLVECNDTAANVYVTPTGLPALTSSTQGDVVRCHRDSDQDQTGTQVDSTLSGESVTFTTPSSGVQIYRIAYRTSRANGTAAAATARIYVPTTPLAFPIPLVAIGHPTEGMADPCAPTMTAGSMADVALPWASRGYAVIATDYVGLGNEGIPGYLDNRDQGYSILDSAKALRKFFPDGTFSDKIVLEGWSQGGGAVLAAQSLAKTYGAGGTLAAVVAFAPEYPIRNNSFALVDMVENPTADIAFDPTDTDLSYSNHVIWTQRAMGYFSNFSMMTTNPAIAFPSSTGSLFVNSMNTLCGEVEIGAAVYLEAKIPPPATNGDLFDPTFRTALAQCFTDATNAACSGLAKEFYTYIGNNVLPADPAGAPILYVQGLLDTVLPPPKEAACIDIKLTADGKAPQLCVDSGAQHTNVTNRNIVYAIGWTQALLGGEALPACPDSASLPVAVCN